MKKAKKSVYTDNISIVLILFCLGSQCGVRSIITRVTLKSMSQQIMVIIKERLPLALFLKVAGHQSVVVLFDLLWRKKKKPDISRGFNIQHFILRISDMFFQVLLEHDYACKSLEVKAHYFRLDSHSENFEPIDL